MNILDVRLGNDSKEFSLALKILSKGNMGDKKKLWLVSIEVSIYFWNCNLMNILDGQLCWK